MANKSSTFTGIGFPALLGLAFIILKLCKVITWSWWWVLCPLYIGAVIGIGFLAALLIFIIAGVVTSRKW